MGRNSLKISGIGQFQGGAAGKSMGSDIEGETDQSRKLVLVQGVLDERRNRADYRSNIVNKSVLRLTRRPCQPRKDVGSRMSIADCQRSMDHWAAVDFVIIGIVIGKQDAPFPFA